MKNQVKFYILITVFSLFSYVGITATDGSNFYENRVSSSVCEGDSNIIKAGCSVAVGQVVRVTPGMLTGVTLDKMNDCYQRFGPSTQNQGKNVVVDLNDPCNQIAMMNPKMEKEKYAYIPFDENSVVTNNRPGIASVASMMEMTSKKATSGLLFNKEYFAAQSLKNVPYLKTSYAAQGTLFSKITDFVYNTWILVRNLAYLILLVASLFLGIVIMLGNQSAMLDKDDKIKLSVERALPRVVLAVILISMSYWIGDLALNTLLGGGIAQGFAAFMSSIFIADTNMEPSFILSFPIVTTLMGAAAGIMLATQGAATIVVVVAVAFAIWKIFMANFMLIRNIFDLLIFIILSPITLIQGVAPSDNTGEAFKTYGIKLITFIATGFMLNLLIYSSKAILVYGTNFDYDTSSVSAVFMAGISMFINWIIAIVGCIYVLGLAKDVPAKAEEFAKSIIKLKKKDKDKDK